MKKSSLKIKVVYTEPLLATASGNKEVHAEYIAAKAKEFKGATTPEETAAKTHEEIETIPESELIEKASTVFHRDATGIFTYDYTWRGHFKECIGAFAELGEVSKLSKWTHKRACDGVIFVNPRRIYLCREGKPLLKPDDTLQRSLRVTTMQGDRVALARSECVNPGTYQQFEVILLNSTNAKSAWSEITPDLIKECLELGILKGAGQWRSGGYGRYTYEILSLDETGKAKAHPAPEKKAA